LELIRGPLHFTVPSTVSIVLNMMIKRVNYWCCFGVFRWYVHHVTKVMKREQNVQQAKQDRISSDRVNG
jgi:hypothetical protein